MKILIWNMGRAIGDGIMSSGYPSFIKKKHPEAEIDLFCTKLHSLAFFNNPHINNIFLFKTKSKNTHMPRSKIIMNPLRQLKNLIFARKRKYDIIIDTSSVNSFLNRFMVKFISSKETKIYGRTDPSKNTKARLKKLSAFYDGVYASCSYEIFDKDIFNKAKYELFCSKEKENKAFEFLKPYIRQNKTIIIFNGEGSNRTISLEKMKSTCNYLINNNLNIHIFFLKYGQVYNKYAKIIEELNSSNIHMTYKTDIEDTACLIKYANILLSVDTSVIHIASAMGTKVIEIINSNKKKNYYPGFPRFVEYEIIYSDNEEGNLDNYNNEEVLKAVEKIGKGT